MSEPFHLSRRRLLGATVAVAGAAGLSGCNLAKGGDSAGGKGGAVLNVWGGVPEETGPGDLLAAFMKKHPDIQVKYTRYTNDPPGNTKLDTALSGGVPIDMYFTYTPAQIYQRAHNGLALDLTDKITAEKDFAQFAVDAKPAGNYSFDGKAYCIPAALAPVTVYINQSMLDDAGIKLADNWTTDEFVEVARKLSKPKRFGTLTAPPLARPALGPDYWYKDAKHSNFGNPWFRKELNLNLKLIKDKVAMDQQTIDAEQLQVFSQTPFISGRVAMLIAAGQIIRSINDTTQYPHDFKTYCMPVPSPIKGKQGWNTGSIGDLIAVSPKSKYQDEAWELAKFWVRNAAKYMTKGGRLPALTGGTSQDDILKLLLSDKADQLYDVASWKRVLFGPTIKLPVDTKFAGGTEIAAMLLKLNDQVLLGDQSVDWWVKQATSQANKAIAKGGA